MHRVVLDTNVLVSAFLFYDPGRLPAELLRHARERRFTLIASAPMLDEVEGVLTRDVRTQERYGYAPEDVATYRMLLETLAVLVEPVPPFPEICRDPDDDLIIATAVVAMADRLVTGDNDLLALSEHRGVRIVSPRQFNDEL